VAADPVVYRSGLTDSSRWRGFEHRPGDIVISTPSKCGTTWVQMLCALLIFGTAELPAPLTVLSPWLDMRLRPLDEVVAQLDAQSHRRFIKTHAPLDALLLRDDVTYLVVGRDPRDVAISMHHHRRNLNGELFGPLAPRPREAQPRSDSVHDRVLAWLFSEKSPTEDLSTLRGTVWHLRTAWQQREAPNMVLLHYADLARDLSSEMQRLATALSIDTAGLAWDGLLHAASFDAMRGRADALVPHEGIALLADNRGFFRRGESGQWRDLLDPEELRRYDELVSTLAEDDFFAQWLHGGRGASA
jgi:aryl sulfotransferase